MARLVIKSGILQPQPIDLKPGSTIVGRAPGNDVELKHPSVSGTHCELTLSGETIFVRDLGSTNGTFINRQPIREGTVAPGQTLHLGAVELFYQPADAVAPTPAPVKATGLRVAKAETPDVDAAPPVVTTLPANPRLPLMPPPVAPAYQTFFQSLPSAFRYPFKHHGLILLVTGSLFFTFMDFLTKHSFGIASLFMGVIGYGYLAAYLQKIIVDSAEGEDELPDYPEFSGFWDDIIHPALLMIGAFAASFGPAVGVVLFLDTSPEMKLMLGIAMGIFGCFYLPMALIAVSMYGSLMALNPLLIVPSMVKTLGPYLVACLMLALLGGTKAGLSALLGMVPVPILPTIIAGFVSLYFVTVEMRVLGLLYYYKKDELGWSF